MKIGLISDTHGLLRTEALAALVITGASTPEDSTASNNNLLPVPALFLAVSVIWLVPEVGGLPLIRPVVVLQVSHSGRSTTSYSSGEWVASI